MAGSIVVDFQEKELFVLFQFLKVSFLKKQKSTAKGVVVLFVRVMPRESKKMG